VLRELIGLRRLASVQALKLEAEIAGRDRKPAHARAVVGKLVKLAASMPETASGRAALDATANDIIDSEGLLQLAELELLAPADRRARALVLTASKRVSVVTAVSPRALVDLGYVLYEAARLIRAVAETYGTRPGRIGMIRLFGDVIAHLAVTGSIAIGDGIVQQLLGHGIASKISARFGEGVINGLMTARIGIAAMDLLRPLPFKAVKRPGIGDFLGDLTGTSNPKPPV
jgi:putative membrane protein